MPIYTFENTKTKKVYDDMMTIAEKEEFLAKNKHIKQLLTTINISSGVVGMGSMKNDGGWNDNLQRIADAHPTSELANRYKKKSIKEVKTKQVIEKHRKRQQGKK
ncbi:hypothetical protein Mosig_00153 [Pelagibacter phage Mosig EXVC030M]|jgi:hypothetical protein|nr:hypothetical protein Mosig_00153 [Pelagibacter phage Mosig EXVC030M]|tara:strand:- start:198 stop:512 length:315 start_codon:yes stop_codon:yes gene_type:complete